MEILGRCHICGRPATGSCSLCGGMVCTDHSKGGMCLKCRRGAYSEESDEEKRLYKDSDTYS